MLPEAVVIVRYQL